MKSSVSKYYKDKDEKYVGDLLMAVRMGQRIGFDAILTEMSDYSLDVNGSSNHCEVSA
jgi:hypothetical protein